MKHPVSEPFLDRRPLQRACDRAYARAERRATLPGEGRSLPTQNLLERAQSGRVSPKDLARKLVARAGLRPAWGLPMPLKGGCRKEGRCEGGARHHAMAYQIAKNIGPMAAVLWGYVYGVVLTRGLAYSEMLARWIRQQTKFIAPVCIIPAEDEMEAMAEGSLRILRCEETPRKYEF